jgi:hypothetical protein
MAIKQVAKGVFEFVSKTAKTAKKVVRKAADATIGRAIDESIDQLSGLAKERQFIKSEQYKKLLEAHPDMGQSYYDQYARKAEKLYGKDWQKEEKKKSW